MQLDTDFDEESYLIEHQDVLDAVMHGVFPSGWAHYDRHGRFENRSLRRHPPGTLSAELRRSMAQFMTMSERVQGWCRGEEARRLFQTAYHLVGDPVIVEIGSFLGSGTILLAGARHACGSGRVHCVDPFDCSGDPYSVPIYENLVSERDGPLRHQFEENIRDAGLADRVEVHQGTAKIIAGSWKTPIDLLFLDGDQSRTGAREAYDNWEPFLKVGGIIVVHNSEDREYAPDHDGNRQIALEELTPPAFTEIEMVPPRSHFARKANPT